MLIVVLLIMAAACAISFHRWQWGILAAIAMGLIQDPLRKMVPGAPGYLAMMTLPIWMSALLSASITGALRWKSFLDGFPRMGRWIYLFSLYLLIPAAISSTYGKNSWMITLLGAVIYSAGFLTMAAGWGFARRPRQINRLLSFYVIGASIMFIGGPIDYFGLAPGFKAVGTAALDAVWMTARTGEIVYMYAGFFRSPDVMGWHAALVTMIAGLLAYRSKGWMRALWIALAVWALLNLWICGRRKMISMLPVFWGGFLILHFKFKSVRLAVPVAGVILLMAGLGWFVITQTYHTTGLNTFYMTTFSQLDDSIAQHGFQSVVGTLKQSGFWGYGLGMGQQGIHHIPAETPRLWQESGPSKLAAELGAPGMFLLLCVFAVLLRTAWAVVSFCRNHSSFSTVAGLFSILIANMASAVVSGQIFGDPFIILFLAFMVGLLWAHPAMIMQQEDSCAS